MTSYVPAKKNTALVFGVSLQSMATSGAFQANPTLASGDVKISKDGGAFANLTNLPTVNPASGKRVEVSLTSTEMNADNITVIFSDAAGGEWADLAIHIQTAARQIDDLAFPATPGRSMVVDASGLVDANAVKLGPTGAGTAQTARDVGASVLISSGTGTGQLDVTAGVIKANLVQMLGTALTETVGGYLAAALKRFLDVATPVFTMATVNQTGDSYARLGAPAGASVSADIAAVNAKTTNLPASPAAVGSAMTLTSGERTAIANEVEAQIIDDTDSEKVLTAITDKIASVNPDLGDLSLAAIASAVRTELTPELGHIDADISSRLADADYTAPDNVGIGSIKAKTDNLPASPAASGDIPTASISAIKGKTDSLTFTETGTVDANVKFVNDTAVSGTGASGDEWGPA